MRRMTFGFTGDGGLGDRLIDSVLRGRKTATCTPKCWYGRDPEDVAEVGEVLSVVDSLGGRRCLIEITAKHEVPFGQIDLETALAEEAAGLAEFRAAHVRDFAEMARSLGEDGWRLTEKTPIIVERFRVATVGVRETAMSDAATLARLVTQLGYPSDGAQVEARLRRLLSEPGQLVLAAEVAGRLVGSLHARTKPTLLADGVAEIVSFVIDEDFRSAGIGGMMLVRLSGWAKEEGCARLRVHSNVVRSRAHAFYEANGFTPIKRSLVLEKSL